MLADAIVVLSMSVILILGNICTGEAFSVYVSAASPSVTTGGSLTGRTSMEIVAFSTE